MKTIAEHEQWSLNDTLAKFEAETRAEECRRHQRFDCIKTVEVVIHPVEEGRRPSRCFLMTQDISRSGLKLTHAVELLSGQRLEVTFDDMPAKHAVVVWCRRLPNKHYSIGCKFVTPEGTNVRETT